jgi:hypothetical protein
MRRRGVSSLLSGVVSRSPGLPLLSRMVLSLHGKVLILPQGEPGGPVIRRHEDSAAGENPTLANVVGEIAALVKGISKAYIATR